MTIHTDLEDLKNPLVQSFGGESNLDDLYVGYYGIQIDDFSFTVSPETAFEIYQKLGEHLKLNGRIG